MSDDNFYVGPCQGTVFAGPSLFYDGHGRVAYFPTAGEAQAALDGAVAAGAAGEVAYCVREATPGRPRSGSQRR